MMLLKKKVDICRSLKEVSDIKNKKLPYYTTIDMLEKYIPNIRNSFSKNIKDKVISTGIENRELDDYREMLTDSFITSYFIDNVAECKAQKAKIGGKKVTKVTKVTKKKKTMKAAIKK